MRLLMHIKCFELCLADTKLLINPSYCFSKSWKKVVTLFSSNLKSCPASERLCGGFFLDHLFPLL